MIVACHIYFTMGIETLNYCLWTAVLLITLSSKMIVSKEHAEYYTAYACDGKILKIECKENYIINLIRANYGRYSITVCNDNGSTDWSVNCMSHRSTSLLQGRCSQRRNCSALASTDLFDDPCPGTVKYLEAHYACVSVSALSSLTRPTPPWLLTSPPSVWLTLKPLTLHSEISTAAISVPPTPTFLSTKSLPNMLDPEYDWALPKTQLPSAELSSEPEVNILHFTNRVVSSTTDLIMPIPDHDETVPMCKPVTVRNLLWNWTSGGEVTVQPCPDSATGLARWRCQTISENLAIRFPDTPDLSECRSMWLTSLENRITEQDSLTKIAADLCSVTESKMLFGGDMLTTVKIIRDLGHKMATDIQTFPDYRQREAMVYELLQSAAQVSSNLLDISLQPSWKDLSHKEQMRVASSLLIGLEENSFLLAETVTREKIVTHCMRNILLSVQVLEVQNVDSKYFPSYTVLENCALRVNNWLQLPKASLLENSDGGFVRLVYTAFDTLEHVLKEHPNHKERKINSKVLSASLGKVRHIQLIQPVVLCLQHLQTENVSNPTCVFWDYMQNQWSEEGCLLVSTNETHTICRCSHLTNFAIMIDQRPTSFTSYSMSLPSQILLSIAILILLVVAGILLTRFVRVQRLRKEYGAAAYALPYGEWLHKCFGCCRSSGESKKKLGCKEPRLAVYGNATMQSMALVADNKNAAMCATHVVTHLPRSMPRPFMAEDNLNDHYFTAARTKLNHNYPTYARNSSVRKMREARHLEHLENTLQGRHKRQTSANSLHLCSLRSHTYSEIASVSNRSDPVYEEIEREHEHKLSDWLSDVSDKETRPGCNASQNSSTSFGDHPSLIPYNAAADRKFQAILDATYRQQLIEHSARTISVLDGETVACHLQQSDPRMYQKSFSRAPNHHY